MFVFEYFYRSLWPAIVVATLAHALVIEHLHCNSDVVLHHSSIKKHRDESVMLMNSLCFQRACDFLMNGGGFMLHIVTTTRILD